MSDMTLFSVMGSPTHPNFSALYRRLKINEQKFNSMRKAISKLNSVRPDYVVAEFFYGYGNNYAGVNISNLDVLLSTLQKYSPDSKVIVIVEKSEHQYVDKLNELFPLHAVFVYPAKETEMEALLR